MGCGAGSLRSARSLLTGVVPAGSTPDHSPVPASQPEVLGFLLRHGLNLHQASRLFEQEGSDPDGIVSRHLQQAAAEIDVADRSLQGHAQSQEDTGQGEGVPGSVAPEIDAKIASESRLLGISYNWVCRELVNIAWTKSRQKPKLKKLKKTELGGLTFIELKDVLGFTETGIGYRKRCPRDGLLDCSIVDAIFAEDNSRRATVFTSWVWQYCMRQVISALQYWFEHLRDLDPGIQCIWWCFFCNNQYRLLTTESSGSLAETFGNSLTSIGRMLITMDRLNDPNYTKRLWCLFEVWVALMKGINIQVTLSQDGIDEFQAVTAKGTFHLKNCLEVESKKATASQPTDATYIQNLIDPQREQVDRVVKKELLRLVCTLSEDLSRSTAGTALSAMDELRNMIESLKEGRRMAQEASGKDLILVLGDTGAGKSTFLNYLSGCKMFAERGATGKMVVKVAEGSEVTKIGHTHRSETAMPCLLPVEDLLFCDVPGSNDTRGIGSRIANAANIHVLLRKAKSARSVILMEYASLVADRGRGIAELSDSLLGLFGSVRTQLDKHQSSILLCISKVPLIDELDAVQVDRDQIVSHFRHLVARDVLYGISQRLQLYHPLDKADQSWLKRDQMMSVLRELDLVTDPKNTCFLALSCTDHVMFNKLIDCLHQELLDRTKAKDSKGVLELRHMLEVLTQLLFDHEFVKLHPELQDTCLNIEGLVEKAVDFDRQEKAQAAFGQVQNLIDQVSTDEITENPNNTVYDVVDSNFEGAGAGLGVPQTFEEVLDAAKIYEDNGNYSCAIDMYLSVKETSSANPDRLEEVWQNAVRLAIIHAPERCDDIVSIVAQRLNMIQRFEAAAELYESIEKAREAVNCYIAGEVWEKAKALAQHQCPDMLRLVEERHIAEQYEMKGNLEKAEHYYVKANMWRSAMSMYRQLEQWEDAQRVAQVHGNNVAFLEIVLAQARATSMENGAEAGAQVLANHNLIDTAIDYEVDHSNFQRAFELATLSATHKMPDIHLKKGLALEDDEQFKLAEDEFIKANKPKEAIDMYVVQRDWVSAMRVAQAYHRDGVEDVMVLHATYLVDQGNLQGAEQLFIKANRAKMAIDMYVRQGDCISALRVAQAYHRDGVEDIIDVMVQHAKDLVDKGNLQGAEQLFIKANKPKEAIDMYVHQRDWVSATRVAQAYHRDGVENVMVLHATYLVDQGNLQGAEQIRAALHPSR